MAILVQSKGARLYTDVYASEGKETVILIHGGPGVPDGQKPVAAFLPKHFQVIARNLKLPLPLR